MAMKPAPAQAGNYTHSIRDVDANRIDRLAGVGLGKSCGSPLLGN